MLILDPIEQQADPAPVYRRTVDLEGVTITYRLRWIARSESWYLDLWNAEGTKILSGARLAPGWPVTWRHPLSGTPPGRLYLSDPSGEYTSPSMEALGLSHHFVYLTAAEVAALPASATSLPAWSVVE